MGLDKINGTGGTFTVQGGSTNGNVFVVNVNSVTTGIAAIQLSTNNLTTGTGFDMNITSAATSNTAIQQARFDLTDNQSTAGNSDLRGFNTNWSSDPTVGTIVFDDIDDSINTIGTLKLQDNPLSGALELFAGKIKLARNGDIETEGIIEAKGVKTQELVITTGQEATTSSQLADTIGQAVLKAGTTSVTVKTTKVKQASKVFVSPTTLISQPLVVTSKVEGDSFTIELGQAAESDVKFDWIIVNTEPITYGR